MFFSHISQAFFFLIPTFTQLNFLFFLSLSLLLPILFVLIFFSHITPFSITIFPSTARHIFDFPRPCHLIFQSPSITMTSFCYFPINLSIFSISFERFCVVKKQNKRSKKLNKGVKPGDRKEAARFFLGCFNMDDILYNWTIHSICKLWSFNTQTRLLFERHFRSLETKKSTSKWSTWFFFFFNIKVTKHLMKIYTACIWVRNSVLFILEESRSHQNDFIWFWWATPLFLWRIFVGCKLVLAKLF